MSLSITNKSLNLENNNEESISKSEISKFGVNNRSNQQDSSNQQIISNSGEQNTLYLYHQYNDNTNTNANSNGNSSESPNNINPNLNFEKTSIIDYDVNQTIKEMEFRVDETNKAFNYRDPKYVIVWIKNNKKKVFKNKIKACIYLNGTFKLDQVLEKDFEIPSGEVKEWKIVLTNKNLFYENGEINVRLHFFNDNSQEECKSIESSITITRS